MDRASEAHTPPPLPSPSPSPSPVPFSVPFALPLPLRLRPLPSHVPFARSLLSTGITVLVDNKALMSVIGTEMDYVEDPESLTAEFVFNNPNVKAMCGCKESFIV